MSSAAGTKDAAVRKWNRAAKALGAPYHAERLWLFLPAGDGLPEARHPLEGAED